MNDDAAAAALYYNAQKLQHQPTSNKNDYNSHALCSAAAAAAVAKVKAHHSSEWDFFEIKQQQ